MSRLAFYANDSFQLHALLLTHTCSKSSVFTLQALFSVVFPDHIPHDVANLYQKGCASLLEAMGEKYLGVKPAFKISRALLTMARVLFTTGQVRKLPLHPTIISNDISYACASLSNHFFIIVFNHSLDVNIHHCICRIKEVKIITLIKES